jgi:hypothetical protein
MKRDLNHVLTEETVPGEIAVDDFEVLNTLRLQRRSHAGNPHIIKYGEPVQINR